MAATNGTGPTLSPDAYALEYEKIWKISEEIFAGTHPRLRVPKQFVRKVAPCRQVQNNGPPPMAKDGTNNQQSEMVKPTAMPPAIVTEAPKTVESMPMTTTPMAPTIHIPPPKPTSKIDPIFLTKSDDLVKAELQLQRQRVERGLREQVEQKRKETRKKTSFMEAKPDFSVTDVLRRALEVVLPVELKPAKGTTSSDENSFYSSRAPDDYSPQSGEPRNSTPDDRRVPDELRRLEALNPSESDQEMRNPVTDQRYPGQAQVDLTTRDDRAETPDGAYSPPPPSVPPLPIQGWPSGAAAAAATTSRSFSSRRRPVSPADDVRIVQNHITSPAAPQPSWVSPLAPASAVRSQTRPILTQVQREATLSPEVPVIRLEPRKRRRVQQDGGGERAASYKRPAFVDYIKEEPISPVPPPSFADEPAVYRKRALYVDVPSPHFRPVDRASVREAAAYEYEPYARVPEEVHVGTATPRAGSRISSRRQVRDDQDLRRVASLNYLKKPDFATHEYVEPSPRVVRAPSYTAVEPVGRRYYDEAPVYSVSPKYGEESLAMGPRPRRIVMDEHGNQYYEMLPAARIQPRPVSRIGGDVFEERMPTRPASVVRASSIVGDGYGERRYVSEMPPPQAAYRRVNNNDYPRPMGYAHGGSMQVADYGRRTSGYDVDEPRVVRVPSVRPARETNVIVDEQPYVEQHRPMREERYYGEPEVPQRFQRY